jgi:hypothetical protein
MDERRPLVCRMRRAYRAAVGGVDSPAPRGQTLSGMALVKSSEAARGGMLRGACVPALLVAAALVMFIVIPSACAADSWIDSGDLSPLLDKVASSSITNVGGVPYLVWDYSPYAPNSLGVFSDRFSGGGWSSAGGGSLDRAGVAASVTNIDGIPYAAFFEPDDQGHFGLVVAKLVNDRWTRVGNPIGDLVIPVQPSMASDNGNPFVAWVQIVPDTGAYGVYVSEFVNGAWQEPQLVSSSTHTVDGTSAASIPVPPSAIPAAGGFVPPTAQTVPYVAWSEYPQFATETTITFRIFVIRCHLGKCVTVGGVIGNGEGVRPSITSVNGVPYVAWCTYRRTVSGYRGCGEIRVVSFSGGAWVPVGGSVNIDDSFAPPPPDNAGGPVIASVGGAPWVAWSDSVGVQVAQFGAGFWESVGGLLAPPALLSMTAVGNVPYISMSGGMGQENLHVQFLMHQKPLSVPSLSASSSSAGITFTVRLTRAATLRFDFTQIGTGREIRGRCARQTARNRGHPLCRRTVTFGTVRFAGHPGLNKLGFNGRLSNHRKLKPGRYQVRLTASTTTGRRSLPQWLSVTM